MKDYSDLKSVKNKFREFSLSIKDSSKLYSTLSTIIEDVDWILNMVASSNENNQPEPIILFASVHHLLLQGADHPLKQYYPSIIANPKTNLTNIGDEFIDFCSSYEEKITQIISNRYVQTNEIGRCRTFIPVFSLVQSMADNTPLALIELGASAGLNLLWDQYLYQYNGSTFGNKDSDVMLECELRDTSSIPLPDSTPQITDRIGIDINPLDINNTDDQQWLKALLWPEQTSRMQRLDSAFKVASDNPPTLIRGDVVETLPEIIKDIQEDAHLVILQSFMFYMLDDDYQEQVEDILIEQSKERNISFISLYLENMQKGDTYLKLSQYINEKVRSHKLAKCHYHGRWIKWLS